MNIFLIRNRIIINNKAVFQWILILIVFNFYIHFVNVVYDLLRRKDQIPTVLILPVIIAHDVQFCLFFYVYYTH